MIPAQRVHPSAHDWPLHGIARSREIEQAALATVPPHTLMRRAGLAVAQLAAAVAPHGRRVWIVAGPGNNGGDGLDAAIHLHHTGREVEVALLADARKLPADALDALSRARDAGVAIHEALPRVWQADLVIDALLGLGTARAPQGALAHAIEAVNRQAAPVLAVDLPSGLHAEHGTPVGETAIRAQHTLSLLTLKPGLFTAHGRDHAGTVWWHPLGIAQEGATDAWLGGGDRLRRLLGPRRHAHHKGSFGDVLVIGGAPGMAGAAWLAARAALALGAGRVFVAPLDPRADALDPEHPELMVRPAAWAGEPGTLAGHTVVCGCGGGDAVRAVLPAVLHHAARLVLDADGLNAIAADAALAPLLRARWRRGQPTVLTPHPLEAARLLRCSAAQVQADRVHAATQLAQAFECTVLLKGSGTVVAAPGATPVINPTGNARLATAGTGDVLAGSLGALWAQRADAAGQDVASAAAWLHGHAADVEHAHARERVLVASRLTEAMRQALP